MMAIDDDSQWPESDDNVELTLETGRGARICWSKRVWRHFETLRNVVQAGMNEGRLAVTTTQEDDTLLYLGALVEWHEDNDQALHTSALCQSAVVAEQQAPNWLAGRTETTCRFDTCFFDSLLEARGGLLGDLVRTVEYLDAPHVMALLGSLIEAHLDNQKPSQSAAAVSMLRCALFGDDAVQACFAECTGVA
jgi:hypothetical protein